MFIPLFVMNVTFSTVRSVAVASIAGITAPAIKERKEKTTPQFNEKPSIIPGCPVTSHQPYAVASAPFAFFAHTVGVQMKLCHRQSPTCLSIVAAGTRWLTRSHLVPAATMANTLNPKHSHPRVEALSS